MTRFGFHASHEQHAPSAPEAAGFDGAMSADHFHPWLEENGQSGFAWSWLGAALASTSMSIGVVNAPGDRYHPANVVQHALSWAPHLDDARRAFYAQWRFAALTEPMLWDLRTPRDFTRATRDVTMDQVVEKILTSADLGEHADRLRAYAELGVEEVYLPERGQESPRVHRRIRPRGSAAFAMILA